MATAAKVAVAEVRHLDDEPMAHGQVQLPGTYIARVVATGE